jgi:hypothetical protein
MGSQFGALREQIDELKKNKTLLQKTMLERINATKDAGSKERVAFLFFCEW